MSGPVPDRGAGRRRERALEALGVFASLLFGAIAPASARAQTLPAVLAAGDLLLVDANNDRILWVRPSTGSAESFSPPPGSFPPPIGSFPAFLEQPVSIVATNQGRIYVVDTGLEAIVEIDPSTGAQRLLLDPTGAPVAATGGIDVDAHGVLYAWHQSDGLVRVELLTNGRWRRTVVSDFDRPLQFPTGGLTLTRGPDGRPTRFFLPVRAWAPTSLPGALWQIDPETGDAEAIPVTEDSGAIYTDAEARGDCQALACTVVYTRCQLNDGIFGNEPSVEVFGIAGIFPLVGTLFDGFAASRCTFSLARGAPADEVFVATGRGFEDARVERIWDDPVQHEVVANLPRGPFDFAPYPVAMTRVVQPTALPVPEPGEGLGALAASLALGALRARRRSCFPS